MQVTIPPMPVVTRLPRMWERLRTMMLRTMRTGRTRLVEARLACWLTGATSCPPILTKAMTVRLPPLQTMLTRPR